MTEFLSRLFPASEGWVHFWKTLEFGREDKLPWVAGFAVLLLLTGWIYRRDTASLNLFWKSWLVTLRLLVLVALLAIALVPQERKSRVTAESSRVVFLVDTSVSMGIHDRQGTGSPGEKADAVPSRTEQVLALLEKSPLLTTLRQTHDLSFYTFDAKLAQQQFLEKLGAKPPPDQAAGVPAAAGLPGTTGPAPPPPAWATLLNPAGLETRLGESLLELIRQENSDTLSGIVVITDGGSNAGTEPATAADAAAAARVRLFPVGVGNTRRPLNLQLADLQAPTHVHIGDGFSLTAFISGQGLAGQAVLVELLSKPEQDEGEPAVIETREITLLEDGVPVTVAFDYTPADSGRRQFRARARLVKPLPELVAEDNEERTTVEVIDRKTRVLLIAGGPMRDYQFVRNLLHRDRSVELDVLLQTGSVGISQESDSLLFNFPATREELFAYDVIVAFDPNWRQLTGDTGEAQQMLSEWVFAHAGGLVLVAGDVNTPQLAAASDEVKQEMERIFELYPVVLDSQPVDEGDEFNQPWPFEFTREGLEAGFLQLTDNAATSAGTWKEFSGIYRCFPTDEPKAGATVFARFPDPHSVRDKPILIASQFFGSGRVMYLGSAELWRLRSLAEDYYDRLWVKMIREVGQGRLLRGTNRAILLLEKKHYALGATIPVRARVLDQQFKDYAADRLTVEVYTPSGRPLTPPLTLTGEKNRPGHFSGAFVAMAPGNYNLELPVPESREQVKDSLSVKLPNIEFDHPEQNVPLLRALARERESEGRYLPIDQAASALPALLPDRSTEKVQFDFPRPLWDRRWVMYALVGLLSVEWLTRKLLKLA